MAPTDEGLSLYVPKGSPAPLDGAPVKEADFRFDHRRLYAEDLYIDGAANRDVAQAALVKRYGKALESDDDTHSYKWAWPGRKVTIEMSYDETHGRTTVTFSVRHCASFRVRRTLSSHSTSPAKRAWVAAMEPSALREAACIVSTLIGEIMEDHVDLALTAVGIEDDGPDRLARAGADIAVLAQALGVLRAHEPDLS